LEGEVSLISGDRDRLVEEESRQKEKMLLEQKERKDAEETLNLKIVKLEEEITRMTTEK